MSVNVKRIGLAILFTIIVTVGIAIYYAWHQEEDSPESMHNVELVEEPAVPKQPAEASQELASESVESKAEDLAAFESNYRFVMVSENNYVVVYELPDREIYEYTDLILDVLPEEVRQEIREEKYIRDEEELYNFLENYTS